MSEDMKKLIAILTLERLEKRFGSARERFENTWYNIQSKHKDDRGNQLEQHKKLVVAFTNSTSYKEKRLQMLVLLHEIHKNERIVYGRILTHSDISSTSRKYKSMDEDSKLQSVMDEIGFKKDVQE